MSKLKMKMANTNNILKLQRIAAKVAGSSSGATTLSPLKSSLPGASMNASSVFKGVTSRQYHTSLSDPCYARDTEEDLDASQFGYRVVSPYHARCYTSTTANASYEADYSDNSHHVSAVTHNSLGQIGTIPDALMSEDVADILASQREWDDILNSESHMEHFEFLKEDPYLSDYEDLESDWHSDSRENEVFEHDVFLGNEVEHYAKPTETREAINPNAMREAVWADANVDLDLCQACIH